MSCEIVFGFDVGVGTAVGEGVGRGMFVGVGGMVVADGIGLNVGTTDAGGNALTTCVETEVGATDELIVDC